MLEVFFGGEVCWDTHDAIGTIINRTVPKETKEQCVIHIISFCCLLFFAFQAGSRDSRAEAVQPGG